MGFRVVITRVISPLIWVIIIFNQFNLLPSPLITTH